MDLIFYNHGNLSFKIMIVTFELCDKSIVSQQISQLNNYILLPIKNDQNQLCVKKGHCVLNPF